jgi:nucleoside-diphosphate-sugar epimerase
MKILLTGATGFVGAHVLRHFAQAHEVTVVARQTAPPKAMEAYLSDYIRADIAEKMPRWSGDACIHVAGLATDKAKYTELYAANVVGTQRLFEAADCPHFVHISSASVYDDARSLHQETDEIPLSKLNFYGQTKRLAELKALEMNGLEKRSLTILRPRAIYGTGDRVLLPRMLNFGKKGKIVAPGDLNVRLSMTHVENLIQAIILSIEQPINDSRIFNVADAEPYLLRTVLLQLLTAIHGGDWRVKALPVGPLLFLARTFEALGLPSKLTQQAIRYLTRDGVLDTTRITQQLGYQPKQDFFSSLVATSEWVKKVGVERVATADAGLPWVV